MFAPILYASLALAVATADDQPKEICVGAPAPKLQIKEFAQGKPIRQFERGTTYVVAFSVDPVRGDFRSIAHLVALQKKYREVVFLDVVNDESYKTIKSLAAKRVSGSTFRVAIELVPKGSGTGMVLNWLNATYRYSASTAFVIDRTGKVAWIGDPQDVDGPLSLILTGKWDLAAKSAQYREEVAVQKAVDAEIDAENRARDERADHLFNALNAAIRTKRYEEALKVADEAEDNGLYFWEDPGIIRLAILSISGMQPRKAEKLAEDILSETHDGPPGPWTVFLAIVAPDLILSEERLSTLDKDRLPEDIRVVPALKLDPALAKIAAEAADAVNENAEAAAETAKERTRDSVPERVTSRIVLANSSLLMARAYQAAGEKEKACREFKKATEALRRTARDANEALDKYRSMEKELAAPKE